MPGSFTLESSASTHSLRARSGQSRNICQMSERQEAALRLGFREGNAFHSPFGEPREAPQPEVMKHLGSGTKVAPCKVANVCAFQ